MFVTSNMQDFYVCWRSVHIKFHIQRVHESLPSDRKAKYKFHAVSRYVVILHSTKISLVQSAYSPKTHGNIILKSNVVMLHPHQKFQWQLWYDRWHELKVCPFKSDVVSNSIKLVWHFVEFWQLIQKIFWDRHTNTMILETFSFHSKKSGLENIM